MITLNVEQGTPEWFQARLGIPTASNFSNIITSTGKPSTQATKYRNKLLAEKLSGESVQIKQTEWMERGIEMEEEARHYYEFERGAEVCQVGMCYQDEDRLWSCSPDGLVGEEGGLEIKCPAPHTQIEYLLSGKVPASYIPQVQGSLWVTGRQWWDFLSYCPGLDPLLIRVERDEKFIASLEALMHKFVEDYNQKLDQLLTAKGAH